ncbi:MAG: hypothetical protein AB2L12_10880 [Smithellaceae bacterium]
MLAKNINRMSRFAKQNGSSMTPRKFVELSEEFKSQKQDWWNQYQQIRKNDQGDWQFSSDIKFNLHSLLFLT